MDPFIIVLISASWYQDRRSTEWWRKEKSLHHLPGEDFSSQKKAHLIRNYILHVHDDDDDNDDDSDDYEW